MKGTLTIMGCGNSTGVPALGNFWGQCDPSEPRNIRRRCSVLIQINDVNIVIDTGPDFREQLNRTGVNHIHAVLFSHAHADHINGIDELRFMAVKEKRLIPVYAHDESLEILKSRFHYLFDGGNHELYPPVVKGHEIASGQLGKVNNVNGVEFIPFKQDHGSCTSLGYRFGDTAYSVDVWDLDEAAIKVLKGVKTWIVDAAAYKSKTNPVHASIEKIFSLNERIGAKAVYLTSLSLAMDYKTLLNELPEGYLPAYDGLEITIEC
ncbi:MAG TPA: MBL fold metallo-hydrolase [Rhodospirillaceae bacterium]|nr:MBL fold metallo-hydrolase [Rhodospirillaceae bacterium]